MEAIHIYGIPNCDVTKKALAWLKKEKLGYIFHDYKKEGASAKKLNEWCKQIDWTILLNKRGTTWKQLPSTIQDGIKDQATAVKIMQEYTSLIKRPVIENAGRIVTGFQEKAYAGLLLKG
ncbi:MAG TPA: Spx/MgsR family RNA polymerase-binding regulatory protein [Ferruginibacter sp.]|nr:Spx/MgsR family RNA polymerase-binding regulatory protein [Ferruginibacter sp.]